MSRIRDAIAVLRGRKVAITPAPHGPWYYHQPAIATSTGTISSSLTITRDP